MKRWIFMLFFIIVIIAVSAWLWWPPWATPNRYSDLGTAMLGGAVVAFAILLLQERSAQAAEKRDLQLQLGLADSFPGIDLKHRNLSGFYLPSKDLRNANLTGANL